MSRRLLFESRRVSSGVHVDVFILCLTDLPAELRMLDGDDAFDACRWRPRRKCECLDDDIMSLSVLVVVLIVNIVKLN